MSFIYLTNIIVIIVKTLINVFNNLYFVIKPRKYFQNV